MTFYLLVFLSLLRADVHAQQAASICLEQTPAPILAEPTPAFQQPVTRNPATQEKYPRLFGVMPTYSVSNNKAPVALSSTAKFHLFIKDTTDPFTITYTAFIAGIQQANNEPPEYGRGAAGYGKRLGTGLADVTSSGFFRGYLFPSLLHQDPRYFREGSGPWKKRFAHALIRPFVTRTDRGGRAFDWSGMLGLIAASSLSNAYYPEHDRGLKPTFERVATGIPFSVIDHLVDEFGPDLEKKFHLKK
jgi:hypothetical protein